MISLLTIASFGNVLFLIPWFIIKYLLLYIYIKSFKYPNIPDYQINILCLALSI